MQGDLKQVYSQQQLCFDPYRMWGAPTAGEINAIIINGMSSRDSEGLLQKLMQHGEALLNEIKQCNSIVLDYFHDNHAVMQYLLKYIMVEGSSESDRDRAFKYPLIATQIFEASPEYITLQLLSQGKSKHLETTTTQASESSQSKISRQSSSLMDEMFAFLRTKSELNEVLAGYWSKVVKTLLDIRPYEITEYIFGSFGIIEDFLYHMHNYSIAEIMSKLFIIESRNLNSNSQDFLRRFTAIKVRIIREAASGFGSYSTEKATNIAEMCAEIISSYSFLQDGKQILECLYEESALNAIFACLVNKNSNKLNSSAAAAVLISALAKNVAIKLNLIQLGVVTDSANLEEMQEYYNEKMPFIKVLIESLKDFKSILNNEDAKVVGRDRLNLIEVLGEVIRIRLPNVIQAVISNSILSYVIMLFFKFEWHNILHRIVAAMIASICESEQSLVKSANIPSYFIHLITDIQLLEQLVDHTGDTRYYFDRFALPNRFTTKGNLGFIISIADALEGVFFSATSSEEIRKVSPIARKRKWISFVEYTLDQHKEKGCRDLGGFDDFLNGKQMNLGEEEGGEDLSMFRDYQRQQVADKYKSKSEYIQSLELQRKYESKKKKQNSASIESAVDGVSLFDQNKNKSVNQSLLPFTTSIHPKTNISQINLGVKQQNEESNSTIHVQSPVENKQQDRQKTRIQSEQIQQILHSEEVELVVSDEEYQEESNISSEESQQNEKQDFSRSDNILTKRAPEEKSEKNQVYSGYLPEKEFKLASYSAGNNNLSGKVQNIVPTKHPSSHFESPHLIHTNPNQQMQQEKQINIDANIKLAAEPISSSDNNSTKKTVPSQPTISQKAVEEIANRDFVPQYLTTETNPKNPKLNVQAPISNQSNDQSGISNCSNSSSIPVKKYEEDLPSFGGKNSIDDLRRSFVRIEKDSLEIQLENYPEYVSEQSKVAELLQVFQILNKNNRDLIHERIVSSKDLLQSFISITNKNCQTLEDCLFEVRNHSLFQEKQFHAQFEKESEMIRLRIESNPDSLNSEFRAIIDSFISKVENDRFERILQIRMQSFQKQRGILENYVIEAKNLNDRLLQFRQFQPNQSSECNRKETDAHSPQFNPSSSSTDKETLNERRIPLSKISLMTDDKKHQLAQQQYPRLTVISSDPSNSPQEQPTSQTKTQSFKNERESSPVLKLFEDRASVNRGDSSNRRSPQFGKITSLDSPAATLNQNSIPTLDLNKRGLLGIECDAQKPKDPYDYQASSSSRSKSPIPYPSSSSSLQQSSNLMPFSQALLAQEERKYAHHHQQGSTANTTFQYLNPNENAFESKRNRGTIYFANSGMENQGAQLHFDKPSVNHRIDNRIPIKSADQSKSPTRQSNSMITTIQQNKANSTTQLLDQQQQNASELQLQQQQIIQPNHLQSPDLDISSLSSRKSKKYHRIFQKDDNGPNAVSPQQGQQQPQQQTPIQQQQEIIRGSLSSSLISIPKSMQGEQQGKKGNDKSDFSASPVSRRSTKAEDRKSFSPFNRKKTLSSNARQLTLSSSAPTIQIIKSPFKNVQNIKFNHSSNQKQGKQQSNHNYAILANDQEVLERTRLEQAEEKTRNGDNLVAKPSTPSASSLLIRNNKIKEITTEGEIGSVELQQSMQFNSKEGNDGQRIRSISNPEIKKIQSRISDSKLHLRDSFHNSNNPIVKNSLNYNVSHSEQKGVTSQQKNIEQTIKIDGQEIRKRDSTTPTYEIQNQSVDRQKQILVSTQTQECSDKQSNREQGHLINYEQPQQEKRETKMLSSSSLYSGNDATSLGNEQLSMADDSFDSQNQERKQVASSSQILDYIQKSNLGKKIKFLSKRFNSKQLDDSNSDSQKQSLP